MEESPIAAVYAAWFRRDDWQEVKALSVGLPDTYDEWHAKASQFAKTFEEGGGRLERVILTAADIRRAYLETGERVDSNARSQLAMIIGEERESKGH